MMQVKNSQQVELHVQDSNGTPIPFANVSYLNEIGQPTGSGTSTNAQGVAMVNGGPVQITHVGFNPVSVEVGPTGASVAMTAANYNLPEFNFTAGNGNLIWWLVAAAIAFAFAGMFIYFDD